MMQSFRVVIDVKLLNTQNQAQQLQLQMAREVAVRFLKLIQVNRSPFTTGSLICASTRIETTRVNSHKHILSYFFRHKYSRAIRFVQIMCVIAFIFMAKMA